MTLAETPQFHNTRFYHIGIRKNGTTNSTNTEIMAPIHNNSLKNSDLLTIVEDTYRHYIAYIVKNPVKFVSL